MPACCFQAEINFAEESGVVQVETFGVSLNAEGTCFYGMQVRHSKWAGEELQLRVGGWCDLQHSIIT